jgi:hypothetical protein
LKVGFDMNPFDFVNSINDKTGNMMETTPDVEGQYNPFVINRAYSYRPDTILLANTMNGVPHLDKRLQYDYYYGSVRKSKKYAKWIKPEHTPDEDAVMRYYSINRRRAREYIAAMTPDDLKAIHKAIDTGGKR